MRPRLDLSLYLVTDQGLSLGRPLGEVVVAAVRGGVTVVQVREKDCGSGGFLEQALSLRRVLGASGVPLCVNDRVDVALAAGAQVVHVGQQDLPCRVVRELVGPGMVVGVSVGSVAEAREAERQGADYVSVSPVFLTPTKPDADQAVGLEGIRAIRDAVRVPVVAIGGLNAGNAGAVIGAGADGVCVVSAIMSAADPEAAARQLLQVIEQARRGKDEAVRDR